MMTPKKHDNVAETKRQTLIARLRELIAALDRRVPHLEREGEQRIAGDSAKLRESARERIAELETDASPSVVPSRTLQSGERVKETPVPDVVAAVVRSA